MTTAIDIPFAVAAIIAALAAGRLGAGLDTARVERRSAWLGFALAGLVLIQVARSVIR